MRWTAVITMCLAAAGAAAGAEFDNGQAGRLVIGQSSFTAERPSLARESLGGVGAVAVAGDKLLVLDSNRIGAAPINNRLLIYDRTVVPPPEAELPVGSTCPACVGVPDVVLGQRDFEASDPGLENGFNAPTAVATDGIRLAVADTNNNRILIWRSIPTGNGAPPDLVLGQPDFRTNLPRTERGGLRGPQGVWFHEGKFFVADTQNSRVLIYNSVPDRNGAEPDVVLGQPDFNTRPSPDLVLSNVTPSAQSMLNPVSATAIGNRLIVTDLGFNRVLIFNSIPAANYTAADIVLGQPDMSTGFSNNSTAQSGLCAPTHQDSDGNDVYPARCAATLSFPRMAISDGTRLYIADGGNDRVLVYNQFPTANGAPADVVLGQRDFIDLAETNSAATLRAPSGLAFDGTNLYVADPFSRRVMVFSAGDRMIAADGLVNAASFAVHSQVKVTLDGLPLAGDEMTLTIAGREYTASTDEDYNLQAIRDSLVYQINEDPGDPLVYARPSVSISDYAKGSVRFGGEIQAGDVVTIRIQNRRYSYTIEPDDVPEGLVYHFISLIRDQGRDPEVHADTDPNDSAVLRFTARVAGPPGDDINYEVILSPGARITADPEGDYLFGGRYRQEVFLISRTPGEFGSFIEVSAAAGGSASFTVNTSGPNLTGGHDARELPAGTQVAIFGRNFAEGEFSPAPDAQELPRELGGVQVYINGIRAPLYAVTPNQINAQVPFEIEGTSLSIYVRSRRGDGQVAVSVPRASTITRAAPGLYAFPGPEPRAAVAVHGMEFARGTIAIDSTSDDANPALPADILVQISINERTYEYVTVADDTPDSVRDKMVELINAGDGDPDVFATAGRSGFLSARTRVRVEGQPRQGDVATITINGRNYTYTAASEVNLATVANRLIAAINAGPGDPDVTARRSTEVGVTAIEIQARALGTEGNDISITVGTSSGSGVRLVSEATGDRLGGGRTPAVVLLQARRPGRDGNDVRYRAFIPDGSAITAVATNTNLCCGNDFFSLITPENPAVPGEVIIVFGTGLGRTTPDFGQDGLETGRPTPLHTLFRVPRNPDDFVSSLAGGRTATVDFVGLMPGFVGVYQVNLILNPDLPDDPMTPLTIAQGLFVSNVVTIPVANRVPRLPAPLQ